MPKFNTDYLKFDADSIKSAIQQKLSENSDFTDHLFDDSNLMILIDVFSHMFEVLTYYTNHGASEAMFTDSQLYENMNRIVKLLGYNPGGRLSPKVTLSFEDAPTFVGSTIFDDSSSRKELPKYSYIDTGKTDAQGNTVYYSFEQRLFINKTNAASDINTHTAINGRWKAYDTTFIAQGEPFEEFTLSSIDLGDTDVPRYIAHPHVDIFIKTTDPVSGEEVFEEYGAVSEGNIFGTSNTTLGPDSKKFELRINEEKKYTIKFGDGIHGKRLTAGDEIYIVYLEGNGADGEIGVEVINDVSLVKWGILGIDRSTFLRMIGLLPTDASNLVSTNEMANLLFKNITASTSYSELESVDTIRANAPVWFRSNNNLITVEDFDQFMISVYGSDIYDVKTMNNWKYVSSFYKWLDDIDELSASIRKYGYSYLDSCDFNNVYIWTKYKSSEIDESLVQESMQSRKCLTCEPKLQKALDVIFAPCLNFANNPSQVQNYANLKYTPSSWDSAIENWIEVIKDKNTFVSVQKIKSNVIKTITDFFDPTVNEIGGTINIADLNTELASIDGVKTIRMAYKVTGASTNTTIYFNGVSFAKWTNTIANAKDVDLIKGGSITLEDFQFPTLYSSDLDSRVKIITESFGQASVEY